MITAEQTIWYPGIANGYVGREGTYAQKISTISLFQLIALVEKRSKEDGEWAIENGFVGAHESTMRKMMAWVSDPVNIAQCIAHILHDPMEQDRTVDWVCRDLANASRWVGGSNV